MKLVQTLVVRDELDIVGTQIEYHLNAGVDFVIATDHESKDGTTDVLEEFARDGYLLRIAERGENLEAGWRTRMARLAATDYGADWVINTDADEFWMPRGASLKETFESVPEPYGVVWALSRHFVPRPDDDRFFAERMTVRVSAPAALNDPTSPYRPHLKAAHRADPDVGVAHGSHSVFTQRWQAVPHWHPFDVLHFPYRSSKQWERKGVRRARGDKPLGQYVRALHASESGRADDVYQGLLVDELRLERGLASGALVEDTRLRDALQAMQGQTREPLDKGVEGELDQTRIAEGAAVRDADVVRLVRYLDALQVRVARLEDRAR